MFRDKELANLIDMAGVLRLTNGWQVVIRAEWIDVTAQRPHGLSYALILQDERGNRLLGFDNAHAYDGAGPDEPFDHEHPAYRVDRRIKYEFKTASALITDGFERIETHCASKGVVFAFLEESP